jgi:N-glycosylase/DNA lyase
MHTVTALPFVLSSEQYTLIEQRLVEFKLLRKSDTYAWFSELCFCLLTANAQARKAIAIQQELGSQGFLCLSEQELAAVIRKHNHRFHHTKARYIIQARQYWCIKELISNLSGMQAREFLVKHIKGIGYKEASHFLRNVGYSDVAIIERHILKFLLRYKYITNIPKTITKNNYLAYETLLTQFGIALDKLDLLIWCFMTGTVLK